MEIKPVKDDKKRYLELLLLADEQEEMIDRYLERGDMYALYDDGLCCISVVTREGEGVCELKNIAVDPAYQQKGYGTAMLKHLFDVYKEECDVMLVGTGETPSTLRFYRNAGFREAFRRHHFFTDHYDHPIFEEGVQLVDMVVLQKDLREG